MKRKFGFTLVEVILASVIIAGFMATTVFTAGEISLARREALATTDRNTWANLQTQFAAEGVKAPSDNANVWGSSAGEFGVIHAQGGSLDFTSTVEDLPAGTVTTHGATGKSVSTSPFLLGLSTIAQRQNLHTTGLSLMDRQSYRAITTSGGSNGDDVSEETMEKPDNLFGFTTSLAVAYYDLTQVKWMISPAQATLDALTQIDWTGGNAFYILAKATTGTIKDMYCTLVGVGNLDEATPPFSNDYDKTYAVDFSSLKYYPGTSITITSVSQNSVGAISYGRAGVTITPVTPNFTVDRVKNTDAITASGTTSGTVTLGDVAHKPLYGQTTYNLFRVRMDSLSGASGSETLSSILSKPRLSPILGYISIYAFFDNTVGGILNTHTAVAVDSIGSAGRYSFAAEPRYFDSGASVVARVQNWSSVVTRPYSALIAKSSAATLALNLSKSNLPSVAFTPPNNSTFSSNLSVKMSPATPLLVASADETGDSGEIYRIYYTINGADPASSSYFVLPGGTAPPISQNTTFKAQSLIYANDPYAPFLNASSMVTASYSNMDMKEATTVMKVNYIRNSLDKAYVQGSIQVLKSCSFNLNGGYTMGLNLYVTGNPNVTLNSNIHYKIFNAEDSTAYQTKTCSIVGSYYSNRYGNGTEGNGGTVNGNSGDTIIVNEVPNGYKMPIIANSSTTVPMVTVPTWSAQNNSWISVNSAANSTRNKYISSQTNYSGNVVLDSGTYNCTFTLDGANSIIYLTGGTYYIYGLNFNGPGQIVTEGDVILYVKNLSLNNSDVKVNMNADGSYASSSGGSVFGSVQHPITIFVASTVNDTMELKGRLFGTLYYNGHVNITNSMVMGKVECNSINLNSGNWLFIKQW